MVLAEIVTYLASKSIGVAGTTLFYGLVPPSPDSVVVVSTYGGRPNEPDMGRGRTRIEWPRIQIVARGAANDQDTPFLKMLAIIAALDLIGSTSADSTLSGVAYKSVSALQPPFPLKVDENFRWHIACNFQVEKDFSTT